MVTSPVSASAAGGAAPDDAAPASVRQDAAVIGVIGLAHGTSHFFHLLLPPMFPVFIREFGVTYAELGLLVSVFFVVSGVGQALAGFLVDRIGARPVLWASMALFAAAALAAASARGLGGLFAAAALAGMGNAPLHPADFTVLNRRVSPARLGHAFSAHSICGNLGWALAPLFLVGVSSLSGQWRAAYVAAAAVALAVLALLVVQRRRLEDAGRGAPTREPPAHAAAPPPAHSLAFLRLPSVWLCFAFFFWTTAALSAIQGFAAPALERLYGLAPALTALVVTGYMLCGALGMVAGGFLAQRTQRLERTIALAMAGAAVLLLLVASGALPGAVAMALVVLSGAGVGLAGPSRDLLIRRAAPPGATGRVYGTVYSGLDLGFALAAPVFGALMDRGWPGAVFGGSALALGAGIASAALVGLRLAPVRAATA